MRLFFLSLLSFLLVGCLGGEKSLREEIEQLRADLKEAKAKSSALSELRKQEISVVKELEILREYDGHLTRLETEVAVQLPKWRAATLQSFVGVQLPEIVTIDGTRYQQVTLTAVTPDSITVTHAGGTTVLKTTTLPIGLRKNLIHEPTVIAEREMEEE